MSRRGKHASVPEVQGDPREMGVRSTRKQWNRATENSS